MAHESSPATAPVHVSRYPVLSGTAAWCLAVLAISLGVLLAFVAVHYLWAQGRSSLARDLERASPVAEPRP